jgi:hypothetical protein
MPSSHPEPSNQPGGPGAGDQPAERDGRARVAPATQPMAPGDEAPAGSPGTGEDVCPACGGSGRAANGSGRCATCGGSGTVTVGIGGA